MNYALGQTQLDDIEEVLKSDIMDLGANSVVLIDMSGNIITHLETAEMHHDVYSLAALAAGHFGAVSAMAKIIGEEEFSLLFHKGSKESMHFNKVMDDFLLITIFGKKVSLGFLRIKVAEAIGKIENTLKK